MSYGVCDKTHMIDYDEVRDLAKKEKPKMIIAGASAYPREIRFDIFREIADEVGAYLFVDMAHIAGLVAVCGYGSYCRSSCGRMSHEPRGICSCCYNNYA